MNLITFEQEVLIGLRYAYLFSPITLLSNLHHLQIRYGALNRLRINSVFLPEFSSLNSSAPGKVANQLD